MIPTDKNPAGPFAEQAPEVTEAQQCPNCNLPQPEIVEPEMSEEEVEQEETPEAVETQQCCHCNLPQLDEDPVPEMELSCACSKPVAMDHGIPVGPEQVLAQYNSRPPLVNVKLVLPASAAPTPVKNPGRPISAIPIQINQNSQYPVSATPIQTRPNPAQPVYVAPRPINKCSKCHNYADPLPARPVHSAPKR
jgi:hypothetical protein